MVVLGAEHFRVVQPLPTRAPKTLSSIIYWDASARLVPQTLRAFGDYFVSSATFSIEALAGGSCTHPGHAFTDYWSCLRAFVVKTTKMLQRSRQQDSQQLLAWKE
eukprot:624416-Amphidinium_carterae.1